MADPAAPGRHPRPVAVAAVPERIASDTAPPAQTGSGHGAQGAVITPYRDGPLIVRGTFTLVDPDGVEIDPGRATVALCRCGKSSLKPFCDGSHVRAGFRAPASPSRPRPATALGDETADRP